jgi:competence protein ComEC
MIAGFGARRVGNARWRTRATRSCERAPAQELGRSSGHVALGTTTWGGISPQAEFAAPARIREWAAVEVGAGRLLPWFAVAFGAGIVVYFSADTEPAWWAASALAAAAALAAALLRRRAVAFAIALGLFAMCAGLAVATLKTALIARPLLRFPAYAVSLTGFVELREESQKTDRFVLRVERIEGNRSLSRETSIS